MFENLSFYFLLLLSMTVLYGVAQLIPHLYMAGANSLLIFWQRNLRTVSAEINFQHHESENWIRLFCGSGGRFLDGNACGLLVEGSQAKDSEVLVRTRLQKGFLAAATLRCNPDRQNGYAAGISTHGKLYIARFGYGTVKYLKKKRWPGAGHPLPRDFQIRFRAEGDRFFLKVWKAGEVEPRQWQVVAEDKMLEQSGFGGVGVTGFRPVLGRSNSAEALFAPPRIWINDREIHSERYQLMPFGS